MRFEETKTDSGRVSPDVEDEMVVSEWERHRSLSASRPEPRQSLSGSRPNPVEEVDTVNTVVKRNLDAWCFAEHMDLPVLLQVTRCRQVAILFQRFRVGWQGRKSRGEQGD